MSKRRSGAFMTLVLILAVAGAGIYLSRMELPAPQRQVEQPLDAAKLLKQE